MITFWWLCNPTLEQFVTFCDCLFDFVSYPLIGTLFTRTESQRCKIIYTFTDRVNNGLHMIFSRCFLSIRFNFWYNKKRKLNALSSLRFFVFLVIVWFEAVFPSKECSLVKGSKTVKWSLMVVVRVSVQATFWVIMWPMQLLEVGVTLVGSLFCNSKSYSSEGVLYYFLSRSSFNVSILKSKSNVSPVKPFKKYNKFFRWSMKLLIVIVSGRYIEHIMYNVLPALVILTFKHSISVLNLER